jgi:hypothetical protein
MSFYQASDFSKININVNDGIYRSKDANARAEDDRRDEYYLCLLFIQESY